MTCRLSRRVLMAGVLIVSMSFPSCAGYMRPYGLIKATAFPVALWLINTGTRDTPHCVLTTSALSLRAWRGDEIEFYLQLTDAAACPAAEVVIENWTRKDGLKESPVEDRANQGANKALKVKGNARKGWYKYDIRVGGARIDPELEIMR